MATVCDSFSLEYEERGLLTIISPFLISWVKLVRSNLTMSSPVTGGPIAALGLPGVEGGTMGGSGFRVLKAPRY